MNKKPVIVVMGVSASGKTTVAERLAGAIGCSFRDADEFHPPENVAKMKGGTPLTDADRAPWLAAIAGQIDAWRATGEGGVVTCSALTRAYRDVVIGDRGDVRLVYLKGTRELILARLQARRGHFMPVGLLDSQYAVLEEPSADERPIVVDIAAAPTEIVAAIAHRL